VLLALTHGEKSVTVTGHPWQTSAEQRVGIASLTAKVPCKRHNSLLSPLDTFMARVLERLMKDTGALRDESATGARVLLVNGHDIERWMLKVLCGVLRARRQSKDGLGGELWTPPAEWLAVLRGRQVLSNGAGLHLDHDPGARWGSIMLHPIIARSVEGASAAGLKLWFHGLVFRLYLRDPRELRGTPRRPEYRRPIEVRWWSDSGLSSLILGWNRDRGIPRLTVPIEMHRTGAAS
jgi:hypothetical protein